MLIFIKENLVFFATPKTASTAIEVILGTSCDMRLSKNPSIKHTPYRKYKRLLEPFVKTVMTKDPDKVAVFREPIDWLGSWYRYRSRAEIIGTPNSTHDISFDQFIEAYLQDEQPAFAKVGSQSKFISSKGGKNGMTHLFSYDQLDELVSFLEKRLKKQIKLPQVNISPKAKLSLSPALKKELQKTYADDFNIYKNI